MTALHLSSDFVLPLELVTSTQAILARKRSGKSYCASVQAEELLEAKQQIAVIDPTGAWHGLRSNAAGDGPGYPVVVFGGDHADAPLDFRAGKAMARALVEHGFSAIFDLGIFETLQQIEFVMEFCAEMLRVNKLPIHIFMDEADTFAPQQTRNPLQFKCLGTVTRLVSQGGIKGIGFTMITQRSAKINWDVLSQIDILTVLRMGAPHDVKPVVEWLKSETTKDFADEVKQALPSLPVGTAFIASAHLGIATRVDIRTRRTFNSGATPKPGERRVEPKVMAQVDIDKLGQQISDSVKRAREESPEFLKKKIQELESKITQESAAMGLSEDVQNMERELEELRPLKKRIEELEVLGARASSLQALVDQMRALLSADSDDPSKYAPQAVLVPPLSVVSSLPGQSSDAAKSGPAQKILGALSQLRSIGVNTPPRIQVCLMSGYGNLASTGFAKAISNLSAAGLVQYGGGSTVSLTAAGLAEAPQVPIIRGNAELHKRIYEAMGGPEMKILQQLIAAYPRAVERDVLMVGAGYSNQASTGFAKALSRLSTLRYVTYPGKGLVVATQQCFIIPEGSVAK